MATQPEVTTGGSRQMLLVGGLAAVLLLIVGLLVVRPLLGRGTSEDLAAPPAVTAGAAPATTTPPTTVGSTTSLPEGGVAGGKDPFRPLVSTGAAAATESGVTAGQTGGSTTDSGVTIGQTGGSATVSTIAATGSTVPGAGAGTASPPGGGAAAERRVTLVSVNGGQARVTVDGRAYTVEEGETFASDYRAVDIGNECASFESGTTPFTLCEGEAVLK
jgi:hypothetical protein